MNILKQVSIGLLLIVNSCKNSVPINNTTIKNVTGFFYVIENNEGVEVYDKYTNKNIYIDSTPIVTAEDFALVETHKDIIDHKVFDIIAITLDKDGTKKFASATKKYFGKRIAILLFG